MGETGEITVNGITIGDIIGTREELAELQGLLEEVVDRCYNGNKKHYLVDLAAKLEEGACSVEKPLCRRMIREIDTWMKQKLAAIRQAQDFVRAIEGLDEEYQPDADECLRCSSADLTEKDLFLTSRQSDRAH